MNEIVLTNAEMTPESRQLLADRREWSRNEIREKNKYLAPLRVGDRVLFVQHVARAGYLFQYRDMPVGELNGKAHDMVMAAFAEDAADNSLSTEIGEDFADTALKLMLGTGVNRWHFLPYYQPGFKHIYRDIQDEWLATMFRAYPENPYIRTFWYREETLGAGRIVRRVTRKIGNRNDGWYSDGEGEPPSFTEWTTQVLYEVDTVAGRRRLVHPLDAMKVE